MKRLFFILVLAILGQCIMAQVTLQPGIPAVGLIQKNQLWNVLVINSSNIQYDCRLELVLSDRASGQEVLTATTNQFYIAPGARQLNINSLAPVQYNYILAGIDNSLQGLLPAGSYTACYALINRGTRLSFAEDCVQFDTEPLSPPMLIFPADSSVLEIAPPQFSWTPPTPAGMLSQLRYEIIITAINDGQKASEALQENIPNYSDGNLLNNVLNYPSSATTFEKNKWYAWQIIARDGRNYAGKSETWTFKIQDTRDINKIIAQTPFIKLKKDNPEKGIAPDGILKISYINETADSMVVVKIIDLGKQHTTIPKFSVLLQPGENLIEYDLKKIMQLKDGKLYEAQIINGRKEKWVMQFEKHQY